MITVDDKIAWIKSHIEMAHRRKLMESDVTHKSFLQHQIDMFESVLADMYAMRLWAKVNSTDPELFDWHILKPHDN